jgi:hypothetical protein
VVAIGILVARMGVGRGSSPPVAAPAITAAAPPATTAPAPPRPPATVTLELDDAPKDVQLWLDGAAVEPPIQVPADGGSHELRARAPGFQERTLRVDASVSRHVTLALPPTPAGTPARIDDAHKHRPRAPRPAELSDDARKL